MGEKLFDILEKYKIKDIRNKVAHGIFSGKPSKDIIKNLKLAFSECKNIF